MSVKILLIEDSKSAAEFICNIFKDENYNFISVHSGNDAKIQLENELFNLVILDLELPDISGLQLLKNIRVIKNQLELPILVISGTIDETKIFKALQLGANDFIGKPFSKLMLQLKIRNILELRQINYNLQMTLEMNQVLSEQLKESIINKDKFFSIIAHDLINPVGAFKELSKLLYESCDSLEEVEKKSLLEVLKNSSANIFELLENLLNWSRSQRGLMQFNPTMLDLNFIFKQLINSISLIALNKEIIITNELCDLVEIQADYNMLQTILRNILSNALKFTPNKGQIILNAVKLENSILFSIQDTGIGIDSATINKLFKINEQISNLGTDNEKGTGLGLILCKEFVEKHNGKIWVESEIGVGSTFYVYLPFLQE